MTPRLSKDELQKLYEKKTDKEISTDFGVSDTTVRRWRRELGVSSLPRSPRNSRPNGRKLISDEDLLQLVPQCFSVAEILRRLGRSSVGSANAAMKLRLETLKADTSHFGTGPRPNYLGKQGSCYPLDYWLKKEGVINTYRIKKRLIKAGLLKDVCSECGLGPEWRSKPLSLQLHHKDSNRRNNALENLRVLCPNCHAQTDKFAGSSNKRAKSDNKPT